MTSIRLVVFDLDGTLVDSSRDLATAVNRTLASFEAPTLDPALVRSFVGEGARRLIEKSVGAVARPLSVDALLPVFLDVYREVLLETTRLYPGVVETLEALAPRRLAVLTNKPGDMSRAILSGLGVAHRFEWIWGFGDVPARKPDPVGLLRLIAAAGVASSETAFVGDSAIDVLTARAAGVRSIGVTYGFDPRAFDEHLHALRFAECRARTRNRCEHLPDARISHPQELPVLFA
jgi:phosphoglycolate phosphatase